MEFDKKTIINLADLSKLDLSQEEVSLYQEQLKDILSYVDKIKKLDLAKIKGSSSGAESGLAPRVDEIGKSFPEVVNQASQIKDAYMVAPNVFDNKS
mgnify:CR=1 FL=1